MTPAVLDELAQAFDLTDAGCAGLISTDTS